MKEKKLTKADIEELFAQLDAAASPETVAHMKFVIIGSAILIQDGMPDRSTGDVDFWQTTTQEYAALERMADRVGIDFNPKDYAARTTPYLQWVSPELVHMPLNEAWQEHTEEVWSGQVIKIARPPIGVILGSKLAIHRDQDIIDIRYIVQAYPEWRTDLEKWIGGFSSEDQENIRDNLVFVDLHLSNDKPSAKKISKRKIK